MHEIPQQDVPQKPEGGQDRQSMSPACPLRHYLEIAPETILKSGCLLVRPLVFLNQSLDPLVKRSFRNQLLVTLLQVPDLQCLRTAFWLQQFSFTPNLA